jgi:hypothetical protein
MKRQEGKKNGVDDIFLKEVMKGTRTTRTKLNPGFSVGWFNGP